MLGYTTDEVRPADWSKRLGLDGVVRYAVHPSPDNTIIPYKSKFVNTQYFLPHIFEYITNGGVCQ